MSPKPVRSQSKSLLQRKGKTTGTTTQNASGGQQEKVDASIEKKAEKVNAMFSLMLDEVRQNQTPNINATK